MYKENQSALRGVNQFRVTGIIFTFNLDKKNHYTYLFASSVTLVINSTEIRSLYRHFLIEIKCRVLTDLKKKGNTRLIIHYHQLIPVYPLHLHRHRHLPRLLHLDLPLLPLLASHPLK